MLPLFTETRGADNERQQRIIQLPEYPQKSTCLCYAVHLTVAGQTQHLRIFATGNHVHPNGLPCVTLVHELVSPMWLTKRYLSRTQACTYAFWTLVRPFSQDGGNVTNSMNPCDK